MQNLLWFVATEPELKRLSTYANRETVFCLKMSDGLIHEFKAPLSVSNNPDRQRIAIYIMLVLGEPLCPNTGIYFMHLGQKLGLSIEESQNNHVLTIPHIIPFSYVEETTKKFQIGGETSL
jgi:hypothetical protein